MRNESLARCCWLLAALPLLALGQKIDVEFDESADFSQYRTFAIGEGRLNSRNPALNSDLIRKQIDAEIRRRLIEKGMTEASGRADLNVRYSLGTANRKEIDAYPAGWRGLGTRRVAVHYAEGTLVLDLRDTKRRDLVWRAIAREEQRDAMKIRGHLDEMVKKALDKYPPKKK